METKLIRIDGVEEWYAKVDEEDFEQVSQYKWSIAKQPHTNYAYRHLYIDDRRTIQAMHTLITGYEIN